MPASTLAKSNAGIRRRRPTPSSPAIAAASVSGGDAVRIVAGAEGRSTPPRPRPQSSSMAMPPGARPGSPTPPSPALSSALASSADRVALHDWTGWPGSKAASGVVHRIIGQMPPHDTYMELFLGYGAVYRAKKPARVNLGFDIDPAIVSKWKLASIAGIDVARADALQILSTPPPSLSALLNQKTTLVYIDAPYLRDVRTRRLYRYEFDTIEQHSKLIDAILQLPCMVMISHYLHALYLNRLHHWRSISFPAMTRGGVRTDWLWMNFPEPTEFHDPRFCGDGFRERERVKRKRNRWVSRFKSMQAFERQIIREALDASERGGSH